MFDALTPGGADLSHYSQLSPIDGNVEVQGIVDMFSWLGTHQLRLKSMLGSADTSPSARGNSGFYNTVYSQPVDFTILNPCLNSTVNEDAQLKIDEMSVKFGQTLLKTQYSGPTDSMSAVYGNGYDKCGPLRY